MEAYVKKRFIKKIHQKYPVKVIFVTEWGSRAYGLESDNSDFDLRFVYIQKDNRVYKEYLNKQMTVNLFELPKVSLETITGKFTKKNESEIDWQGWDVTKAVKHLYEMNSSIFEWIYSPLVYYNNPNYEFLENAKRLLKSQHRISPLIKHYKLMAKTHYEEYVKGMSEVIIKKYAVVARCAIMVKWLLINYKSLLKHKDITIDTFEVLLDLKSKLSYWQYKRLYGILWLKKNSPKDWKQSPNDIALIFLDSIIYNTDKSYTHIKLEEQYEEESFRKYNKFLRNLLAIKFNI